MTDKISNTLHSVKGGVKETLGHGIGNQRMATHGEVEKNEARAAKQMNHGEHQVKGVEHNVQGETQKAVGDVTNDRTMEARGHGNSAIGDIERRL